MCIIRLLAKTNLPPSVKVRFALEDFFKLEATGDEKFDLVYDYT